MPGLKVVLKRVKKSSIFRLHFWPRLLAKCDYLDGIGIEETEISMDVELGEFNVLAPMQDSAWTDWTDSAWTLPSIVHLSTDT